MSVRVVNQFKGVKDGEVYPCTFEPGAELTGDLARVAVENGDAAEDGDQEPALGEGSDEVEVDPKPAAKKAGKLT